MFRPKIRDVVVGGVCFAAGAGGFAGVEHLVRESAKKAESAVETAQQLNTERMLASLGYIPAQSIIEHQTEVLPNFDAQGNMRFVRCANFLFNLHTSPITGLDVLQILELSDYSNGPNYGTQDVSPDQFAQICP